MFLLVASGMAKYTAYSSGQNNDVFNSMPYSIKALLGFGSLDVTAMSGYFALLFLYMELAAAIHAALLGSGIIAKEERDKTTEFLMVKPVSRSRILTAKLLAAFANVLLLNLVTLVCSLALVCAYNKGKDISGEVTLFLVSMLLVQLIFLSLGAALSAGLRNPKLSGSAATGILLGSFAVSKITDLTDRLNALNLLSPFKYFSYAALAKGKGLDAAAAVFSCALAAAFTAAVYVFYRRRDLKI